MAQCTLTINGSIFPSWHADVQQHYSINDQGDRGEWRVHGPRPNTLLENLSKMLNSNGKFELADLFNLVFVYVHCSPVENRPPC